MTDRLQRLRNSILARLPTSHLRTLTAEELTGLLAGHPDLPQHLRELFTTAGVGRIGDGRYMIHGHSGPDEIFDPTTAASLAGVVIVGDDFAGTCDAYDTKRAWGFGSIGVNGEFVPNDRGDFVDFLENRYGDRTTG